ncbi:hypothetical protein FB45DRAFT_872002 [Roridomyces roridus]|uniref:Uncharacterized protein n=1 Tax=Roridomyces roridus TaxID=1738132 RepID=A0AAD7BEM2_9AGAR|nr:hypothetical protein FB45DRAFT_872002 [Roridomyces roridus]
MHGMMQGSPREIRLQDIHLLLENAAKNVDTWMDIAAPDDPQRPPVAAVGIRIDLILRGHTMTAVDFETAQKKLTFAYDLTRFSPVCWRGFDPTKQCIALEKLFNHVPNAWKVWAPTILRHPSDVYTNSAGTGAADPQAELAAWVAKLCTNSTRGTHERSIEADMEMQSIKPGARRNVLDVKRRVCTNRETFGLAWVAIVAAKKNENSCNVLLLGPMFQENFAFTTQCSFDGSYHAFCRISFQETCESRVNHYGLRIPPGCTDGTSGLHCSIAINDETWSRNSRELIQQDNGPPAEHAHTILLLTSITLGTRVADRQSRQAGELLAAEEAERYPILSG